MRDYRWLETLRLAARPELAEAPARQRLDFLLIATWLVIVVIPVFVVAALFLRINH